MKTSSNYHIRLDVPETEQSRLLLLISKISDYYVCAFEIGKTSKKEHFHITVSSTLHVDTLRRKVKKEFGVTKSQIYVRTVDILYKMLAYTIKDGKYTSTWQSEADMQNAKQYLIDFQIEHSLKTLKQKCLFYLNKQEIEEPGNTVLMRIILKWFKEKQLSYPSTHWIKNVTISYLMQKETDDAYDNIASLYNIRNPSVY